MTARQATLDPAGPSDDAFDDAFFDALVGLDRVCRHLAHVIDGAIGDTSDGATIAEGGAPVIQPLDEPLDAMLGLVSVRTTVALLLDALRGELADAEPAAAAAWSRELLR